MLSLSIEQSLLACCLVLVVGRALTNNVGVLSRYSIPDPIVGGLLFAIVAFFITDWSGFQLALDTSIKPTLLLLFFSCIGLTANLKLLAAGGPRLVVFCWHWCRFWYCRTSSAWVSHGCLTCIRSWA
jgi:ESS family glutamate:Na+ symporter|tara:strand:- start:41899 stop:42279 length:381 start_codon:yes stop_codon:yes gene_type:complete